MHQTSCCNYCSQLDLRKLEFCRSSQISSVPKCVVIIPQHYQNKNLITHMKTDMRTFCTVGLYSFVTISNVIAFIPQTNTFSKIRLVARRNNPLQASFSPSEAIQKLGNAQVDLMEDIITSKIPDLAKKSDASWTDDDKIEIGGKLATLDARDAPGPANVAWLSSLKVEDTLSSLTIFNGPLTNVPHLLFRCFVEDENTLKFDLDFRPRAYGAYEMKDEEGNYPGPDKLGRDAFTYSGNRKEFDTNFGNAKVVDTLQVFTHSLEDASARDLSKNEYDVLTNGPLALSLSIPMTEKNIDLLIQTRKDVVEYWLEWATSDDFEHRPGAPVNSQYVYDSKFRINAYSGLLDLYSNLLGKGDGAKLAAAESGPLDEAYVGGGS